MPLKPFNKANRTVPDLDEHILDVKLCEDEDVMIQRMKDHAKSKFEKREDYTARESETVATTAAQAYMQAVQLEQERAAIRAKQKILRAGSKPSQKRR